MKAAFAAIAAIMLSLAASATSNPPGCDSGRSQATSCTTTYYGPVYVNGFGSAFIPCLNHGKGENVVFSATEATIFYYTVANGKRNGFFMFTGGGLQGKGETTGIQYTARGSTQDTVANWVPFNPDGSANGDGDFTYTDNYYVFSHTPGVNLNYIWHRTQRFTITNNGNNLSIQPDEVVCN